MSTQYYDDLSKVTENEPVNTPWPGTRVRAFAKVNERLTTRNEVSTLESCVESVLDEDLKTFDAINEKNVCCQECRYGCEYEVE